MLDLLYLLNWSDRPERRGLLEDAILSLIHGMILLACAFVIGLAITEAR